MKKLKSKIEIIGKYRSVFFYVAIYERLKSIQSQ